MILALDQGTTGSTAIVFDERGPRRRARLPRVRPALPAAGLGRARRRRDLGGDAAGGAGGARRRRHRRPRARRDRHHQPARDRRGLGPQDGRAAAPGAGVAGPPHGGRCDELREEGHEHAGPRAHGPRARPLLLGHEDRVADPRGRRRPGRRRLRHDRLVAGLQAHGPRTPPTTRTPRARCCSTSASSDWDAELCGPLGVDPASLPEPRANDAGFGETEGFRRPGTGRGHRGCRVSWRPLPLDPAGFDIPGAAGLNFTALALSSKAPPFSPHRTDPQAGDNVGLSIRDTRTGAQLFYAPGLGRMEPHVWQAMQASRLRTRRRHLLDRGRVDPARRVDEAVAGHGASSAFRCRRHDRVARTGLPASSGGC